MKNTRDQTFILVKETQVLHLAICDYLIDSTDEKYEVVRIMLDKVKKLAREL